MGLNQIHLLEVLGDRRTLIALRWFLRCGGGVHRIAQDRVGTGESMTELGLV